MLLQTIYGIEALAVEDHLGFLADIFNTEIKKAQVKHALENLKRIKATNGIDKAIAKLEHLWERLNHEPL